MTRHHQYPISVPSGAFFDDASWETLDCGSAVLTQRERDRTFHTQNGVQTLVRMYKDPQKLANWGQFGVKMQR